MKILQALVIIAVLISITSCKKGGIFSPDTSLEITIKDDANNSVVPGATVQLFASETDREDQKNIIATQLTAPNGVVKFIGLKPIRYYWSAELGCKVNAFLPNSTATPITSEKNTIINAKIQGVGLMTFTNSSSNPYQVFVNGVMVNESQTGKTTESIYFPAKAVTIRVLQISGYILTPTDKTYTGTLTCGGTLALTYPF